MAYGTRKIHADDAGRGPGDDSGAAPAEGQASRQQQGPGLNERPRWWRTMRGRSYKLHCGCASRTGATRRRRRRAGADGHRGRTVPSRTRTAVVYTLLDQYYLPGRVTRLFRQECGEGR